MEKKKTYIKPNSELVGLFLNGRIMYEGGQMYTPTASGHKEKAQENINNATEEEGVGVAGAKSFHVWEDGGLTGWGD